MRFIAQSCLCAGALLLAAAGCDSTPAKGDADLSTEVGRQSVAAWATIYAVLEHPRCANCHPDDRVPRQGDDMHAHVQDIKAGADGRGGAGLHCDACHRNTNAGPSPMPPGAQGWRMPTADMPLVFVGRSSGELCRQLKDRRRNGGRSHEDLFEHMAKDPLVLWGWDPGEGRTPVHISHEEFVRAARAWVDGGCGCPE